MTRPPTPEQAWARIAQELSPLAIEKAPRSASVGRALAEDLEATVDVPAYDVSAMDGYAVGSPVETGQRLPVEATIAAGDAPGLDLESATAVRIMTGAPVPPSASAVVPIEQTDGGLEAVEFTAASLEGAHIRRRGEVVKAGSPLLSAGHLLTPGAQSLLATHGHGEVSVYKRPSVATLSTGDEVVPPDQIPEPGQLRDSHTAFLAAAGNGLGLSFTPLGIARDNPEDLLAFLERGIQHDVLLVSGGVSMGAFDFVEPVLAKLGCRILIESVAVQPGKPLVIARHPGGWVVGLPGNPGSVMVSFWLFVRPLLRALQGLRDGFWHGALTATLKAALPAGKDRDRFLSARVETHEGRILVHPCLPQGSHDVVAFAHGRALVRVRPGAAKAAPGDSCEVLPLSDWPLPDSAG